ncbi:MAG: OmpA family protein [Paludibacteraceae bacterium]|nr:OmpA family protein [Paludibacteraceae bacterium]
MPDYLDQCKNTPNGVEVDTTGCPYDTDRDGVPDYLDQCPETPEGVAVNDKGCAMDEDLDGVPDFRDQCHDTPRGVIVDENGCPLDRDDDGVPDYLDQCPDEQGPASNNGCPELTEVRELFKKAMTGIQFETGKATIKKSSYGILNKIAEMLSIDNSYNLEINGHTDNVGDPEKNLNLSRERAESVRNYLIGRGIAAERLKSEGYGDTQPIADNSTKKGREQNRRVEFNIVYEKISYQ